MTPTRPRPASDSPRPSDVPAGTADLGRGERSGDGPTPPDGEAGGEVAPTEGRDLLSIGALAQATGISPDTIRIWERRYGRPVAVRLPSGHRRYTQAHVCWLRRVAEALGRGLRASEVVSADAAALDRMLERSSTGTEFEPRHLLQLARQWRAGEIRDSLRDSYRSLGVRGFLEQRIAPLLKGVGSAWADGRLDVRHEHFLTETIEDLLRAFRLDLPLAEDAPLCVLATLEGEVHALGLQFAALVCAENGVRPVLLGRSSPNAEIAAAVRETGARGVGIAVSSANAGVATDRQLSELRSMLPGRVRLAVGGTAARGARRGPRGIDYFDSPGFGEFESWLEDLAGA